MKNYFSLILSILLFTLVSLPNNSFGFVINLGDEFYVIPNPSVFTAEMLDASPTYYAIYSDDNGGTIQSTYKFSGTNPYVTTVTDESFNASGVSQGQETGDVDIVLNANGTLTATVQGEPAPTVISLTSKTDTYLNVHGVVDGTETWDETWYFTAPEGWLTSDGTPSVFTAEMLDAGPTYYGIVPKDNGRTEQTTIAVSGTGPYVWTVTEEDFNASGVSQGQVTFDVDITLNADGTLTATEQGEPGSTVISLTSKTDTYLDVHGVFDGTETWDETWYFTAPAGWLESNHTPNEIITGITQTLADLRAVVNSQGNSLSRSHLTPFFDENFKEDGVDRQLYTAYVADDLRGVVLPVNYHQVISLVEYDALNKVASVIIEDPEGLQETWWFRMAADSTWKMYGNQWPVDCGIELAIAKFYSASGAVVRYGSWLNVDTYDNELTSVSVTGSIYPQPQDVPLNYTQTLEFFYTPAASLTTLYRHYELYYDQFSVIPPAGTPFSVSVNDEGVIHNLTCLSNYVANEPLNGSGPTDYSVNTLKGQQATFSFTPPTSFNVVESNWMWNANSAGPWFEIPAGSQTATSVTYDFPTQALIEGVVQDIEWIMVQVRVVGPNQGEESVIYWQYGF